MRTTPALRQEGGKNSARSLRSRRLAVSCFSGKFTAETQSTLRSRRENYFSSRLL